LRVLNVRERRDFGRVVFVDIRLAPSGNSILGGGGGGGGGDDLGDELDGAQPISEQDQQFMDKVDANVAEQDEILTQISKGLDELKDIGLEMNKALAVQSAMIEEIDTKMDETIAKFKTANGRLKDILEQSGGLSRWCPMIICLCLLLGLIGYAVHVSKQ